jgi:hypothetical protein
MKYFHAVFLFLLFATSSYAQEIPCLKVTLSKQIATDSNSTGWDFLVTVENTGKSPVQLFSYLALTYEEDDDQESNLYFVTYYSDKHGGLISFNHHQVDYQRLLTTTGPELVWLKPKEKLSLICDPFAYSGLIEGERNYSVMCAYRIRKKCGDILYKSNYVDVEIK